MCGIFAALGRAVTEPALDNVFRLLRHRGPDGKGLYVDASGSLTLAHTRLAVIDLKTGDQPMQSADGSLVLVANGEIYDFERIRRDLESKGYRFRTASDSEVILYLYQEYGLACFEHLRGEFAFLLYDKAAGRLIAARDRFGIKPLYFARLSHGFVFASEMKAIFASGLFRPRLDAAGLDPLLDQDPDNVRFPFAGIEHVAPGSYVAIDLATHEVETERYWHLDLTTSPQPNVGEPSPDIAAAAILEDLETSVRLRLRADVPVGLYLSGGIDSAFVAALMKRNLSSQLHSFSICFSGSERDERGFARRAAEFVGTRHHELEVTKQALWANLKDAVWHSELPFVSLAPVGKFLLSQEARKHVTVVLTGEGADEVFLGYRSYFGKALDEGRTGAPAPVSSARRRLKLPPLAARLSLLMFDTRHRDALISERASAAERSGAASSAIHSAQEARLAAMPLDILCYLGDREEMAHSLEARLPFLDHRLYARAKDIPPALKMRGGVEKAVLRDAAQGILPDDIRLRRKSGFMLTSEAVDFFGRDRSSTEHLRQAYLTREAFERAGVFSYPMYRALSFAARIPGSSRFKSARRLRRNANKVIMYMMQAHMLQDMFVDNPRWMNREPAVDPARVFEPA